MSNVKKIGVRIQTTEAHLEQIGFSVEGVRAEVEYLTECFRSNFTGFFGRNFRSQDIDKVIFVSNILKQVENCRGFRRHLDQYSKTSFDDHLFTARVAAWLLDQGYNVEMEPELVSPYGKEPDLLVTMNGSKSFVVECKNIDISKYFEPAKKEEIADIVFEKVETCDHLTLYLGEDFSLEDISNAFGDKNLVANIHRLGMSAENSNLVVGENLTINVKRMPPIVGAPESFPSVTTGMVLENNASKGRVPGFVFSKCGRSVGVFGPMPSYNNIWSSQRRKSKRQAVAGLPMIVMTNGDNVLGDPQLHEEFRQKVWLTEQNAQCSGVGILHFATLEGQPSLEYFPNSQASHPFQI